MKRIMLIIIAVLAVCCMAGCGDKNTAPDKSETDADKEAAEEATVLVAYFSATGKTRPVAENIAKAANADIFEIVPADDYSSEDLDYNNDDCRANREQQDSSSRPEISGTVENIDQYEVVFIGHPIWWGEEPRIIDTFVETYDLSGKTVIDFCTSGGSGISDSESNLKTLCPDSVKWMPGKRFESDVSMEEIRSWVDEILK